MRISPGTVLTAGVLVFDMDGTLIDSSALITTLWRKWAERYGVDPVAVVHASAGRRAIETVRLVAREGVDASAVFPTGALDEMAVGESDIHQDFTNAFLIEGEAIGRTTISKTSEFHAKLRLGVRQTAREKLCPFAGVVKVVSLRAIWNGSAQDQSSVGPKNGLPRNYGRSLAGCSAFFTLYLEVL